METKSLKTDLTDLNNEGMDIIREVLKTDKDRLVFSPENPKDGLSVTIVWGDGKGEDSRQDPQKQQERGQEQKDRGQKGQKKERGQEKGQEEGQEEDGEEGGEEGEGPGEGHQEGDSEGGSDRSGNERGKQGKGGEKGGKEKEGGEKGGKGDKGEEEEKGEGEPGGKDRGGERGEEEGKSPGEDGEKKGEGGEKEGDGKGKGKEKEDGEGQPGSSGEGGQGNQGKDPDDLDIDDILGGGNNKGKGGDDDDWGNGQYEDDRKKGKDKEREKTKGKGKDDKGDGGKKGDKRGSDKDDQEMETETSYEGEFPPTGNEEPDPKILDVVFGKSRQVEEREDKLIQRSFVFSANNEQIQVFKIEYKGRSGTGDRTYIKKLAKLVFYLYEPYLKASSTDLDPSEPVIPSPISPQGLRSPRPHERPMISYGAISRVDKVDFNSLIVFIDVSGSMDMNMVARAVNSYFYSVFSGLKKPGSQVVKVIVVLHGTNAGVFGVSASWRSAGGIIAKVAESSRNLVGYGNDSESTLTHRIVDILKTVDPLPGANINHFLWGQVPILWITDFLWSVSVSSQFANFLRNKPALLLSTIADPGGGGGAEENVFERLGQDTALTILRKVPYGALVFFPSFAGISSGDFDPNKSSSLGSGTRVYAKGQAYEQLLNSRGKIGQITVIRVK